MRERRLKIVDGVGIYHCMSRVVEGRYLFDMKGGASAEAEYFVGLMRRLEVFCGVEIITYALMSNHFHILVQVPAEKPDLSDGELVERVRGLNGADAAGDLEWLIGNLHKQDPTGNGVRRLKARYLARMGDVSEFLRELKGRFAQWFNRRHDRYGVLWADRFKSVLVENPAPGGPNVEALITMANYIDLNPVRAGLCEDPKDYRYCGYGEAVSSTKKGVRDRARAGLVSALGEVGRGDRRGAGAKETGRAVREMMALYRQQLFGTVLEEIEGKGVIKGRSSAELARQTLKAGGKLDRPGILRCRVRYFTDGLVLGSKEFVEGIFESQRERFGERRKSGARKMKGADWGGLCVVRDLRRKPIG